MKRHLAWIKRRGWETEKLFQKIGITTTEELLYYPCGPTIYMRNQEIALTEEDKTVSIRVTIATGIYITRYAISRFWQQSVADASGRIAGCLFTRLIWKRTLKRQCVYPQRKITRKRPSADGTSGDFYTGSLWRDHHSMQACIWSGRRLSTRWITKLVPSDLDKALHGEYLPEEYTGTLSARRCHCDPDHPFPKHAGLLTARKRPIFDNFAFKSSNNTALKLRKQKECSKHFSFQETSMEQTEEIIEGLPWRPRPALQNTWHETEIGIWAVISRCPGLQEGDSSARTHIRIFS